MIDILALDIKDLGAWVEYKGGAGEKEKGRIKSWNDTYIFVVYKCANEWDRYKDFTGVATSPKDLSYTDL